MRSPWTHRLIMTGLIGLLLIGLWLTIVPLVRAATAPGQRVHSLVQVELPSGVLLVVVIPAYAGRDGEVALWWSGYNERKVRPLVRMMGTPALRFAPKPRRQPRLRQGEIST